MCLLCRQSPIHRLMSHPDQFREAPWILSAAGVNEVSAWDVSRADCTQVFRSAPSPLSSDAGSSRAGPLKMTVRSFCVISTCDRLDTFLNLHRLLCSHWVCHHCTIWECAIFRQHELLVHTRLRHLCRRAGQLLHWLRLLRPRSVPWYAHHRASRHRC